MSKKNDSEVAFLEIPGMSLRTQEIWVNEFTEQSALKFRQQVLDASKQDPSRPIIVYIDSYGGYVDSLAKMIDTLDEVPNPIVTACMGKAMSCGAILLSHGDVRFLGKNSRVMVHEVSSGTIGNVHDMEVDTKETKRLNEHFLGLLAKNCGFKSYKELRSIIKDNDGTDLYMSGQDAINFGIVDRIGTPKLVSKVFHEIGQQPSKQIICDKTKQTLTECATPPSSTKVPKKPSKKTPKKVTKKATKKSQKSESNNKSV